MAAVPFETNESPAAGGAGGRVSRLLRAHPSDPGWARPALAGLLLATALLYLAGLGRNGWGNEFYAAAVQAGSRSWKAFLFGSLDSSNFITVDKPAGAAVAFSPPPADTFSDKLAATGSQTGRRSGSRVCPPGFSNDRCHVVPRAMRAAVTMRRSPGSTSRVPGKYRAYT